MKLNHLKRNQSKRPQGFTLVEMLLVVAIIGTLAALVIPKIAGTGEHSKEVAAGADIHGGIKTALDRYEIDNGTYPRSLNDLVQAPSDAKHWNGPYLDQVPVDPWGNAYIYYFPGKHNASGYDLLSMGLDAKEGTDDDIGNW
ncbi:MAG TPA: type II secretion system major pseudopilin GspG [Verrucomicrobiae bacterium]|jgi:general secretion pathway protein G|nr:type II secretion system major pseudopilin GspG [Verrucomicrobiae bacterium]